ncbi:MAG: two-component regulator propeller domain-containing protein [Bacteroidales bacterium]
MQLIRYLFTFFLCFSNFLSAYCQEWVYKELFKSWGFGNIEFKSLLSGAEGFLYLGTTGGLFITDGYNKSLVLLSDSLKAQSITSLGEYSTNELIVGTASGLLLKISLPDGKIEQIASTGSEIRDILITNEKEIWFATYGKGLYHLKDSLRIINTGNGLLDDYCYCLESDTSGNIWVGTDRGINIISPNGSVTHSITHEEGLPDVLITALFLDDTGRMWVGMESAGVCYLDMDPDAKKVVSPFSSWEYGMVTGILQSSRNIIAATKNKGILDLQDIIESDSYNKQP